MSINPHNPYLAKYEEALRARVLIEVTSGSPTFTLTFPVKTGAPVCSLRLRTIERQSSGT